MSGFVGRLRAKLGLDTAEFDAGMRGAQVRARTGFGGAFAAAGRMITPLTAGLAAVGAASYAIVAPTLRAAQSIDEAAKAARRVDGSLAGWESLRLSAGEAGVEVGQLADQVQNLNTRLAAPNAEAQSALARLGLDARALRDLDVDARVAAIADAVRRLGLDAGQATGILRGLGIEDRRTAAMMVAGGEAIRAAARDIDQFGLAVSEIDASRIEVANDQISRLSLVSRYFGQQMALQVVPVLGEFAQGMTESLREGGALRAVIDTLVGGLSGFLGLVRDLGTIGGGLVTWLRDLTSGLVATDGPLRGMTETLGTAGTTLWTLVRTLTGLSAVAWFADLIRGAGGAGQALTQLGDLAIGVWRGIVTAAGGIPAGLAQYWHTIRAEFSAMVFDLVRQWAGFLQTFSAGLPDLDIFDGMRATIDGARTSALEFQRDLNAATYQARTAAAEAGAAFDAATSFGDARAALTALTDSVARGNQTTAVAANTTAQLTTALDAVPTSASGAASGLRQVSDAASQIQSQISKGADAVTSLFSAITGGEGGARQALSRLIAQIAEAQFRAALISAAGSGGGFLKFVGSLLMPGNARGTPSWRGGLTMVGEDGPELVNLPQGTRISSAQSTGAMLRNGAGRVEVAVRMEKDGNLQAFVERTSGAVVRAASPGIVRQAVGATYSANREVPFR